jgi:hypothetical protein
MDRTWGESNQEIDKTWENRWAPHDDATYQVVMDAIHSDDVVLEIGAGDLRLARRLAPLAKKVYAIERQLPLLAPGQHEPDGDFPPNLQVIWGDARTIPFPAGITTGVLLMRHCTHFRLYWDKLAAAGARQMYTNARLRMAVEMIDLGQSRAPIGSIKFGWYGCWCGSIGFIPGNPDLLTPAALTHVHEVAGCPNCLAAEDAHPLKRL